MRRWGCFFSVLANMTSWVTRIYIICSKNHKLLRWKGEVQTKEGNTYSVPFVIKYLDRVVCTLIGLHGLIVTTFLKINARHYYHFLKKFKLLFGRGGTYTWTFTLIVNKIFRWASRSTNKLTIYDLDLDLLTILN